MDDTRNIIPTISTISILAAIITADETPKYPFGEKSAPSTDISDIRYNIGR